MKEYDDIINLSRPISNRKKQPTESRAAQFAPFAALNGYYDTINETARTTSEKKIIDQSSINILNEKLNWIQKNIKNKVNVTILYFEKDLKKEGGKYITKTNTIKKINMIEKYIMFIDNDKIKLDDIIDINIIDES